MGRYRSHHNRSRLRQPGSNLILRTPAAVALTLMLVVAWLLTHRYQGLAQDARIYAIQALARIEPTLSRDLYLQYTSQDRYTLFSPFYALVIEVLGLQEAARILTLVFAAAFLTASWKLAGALMKKEEAWLSVGALILTVGAYGSYRVFHFSEDYLTARSAAEALVAIALAVYFCGPRWIAMLFAAAALLIHPLMALPGVMLLIFLALRTGAAAAVALTGIVVAACLALADSRLPWLQHLLPIMDGAWLGIVMERSQFLFLQLWSVHDWEVNLRPFFSLGLSAMVLATDRTRSLCVAAALVGASGLIVALVAGTIGPVAFLVQGQAWRWVWIPVFVATILMPPTALRLWRNKGIGPVAALLLAAAWTIPAADAPVLATAALVLFLRQRRLSALHPRQLAAAALAVGIGLLIWDIIPVVISATRIGSSSLNTITDPPFLQNADTIAAFRYPIVLLFLVAWHYVSLSKDNLLPACLAIAMGAACVLLVPMAFAKTDTAGSAREIEEFTDWRSVIPPSADVYVANGHDAAPFAWFTLQRPNYLSLDQSAGVVFSRLTALEVRRRSEVLIPLMDEDWKLLSRNRALRSGSTKAERLKPLTAKSLQGVCSDPQLNFLIARENVGFDPIRHKHPGPWMNWNLYDCAHVRSIADAD